MDMNEFKIEKNQLILQGNFTVKQTLDFPMTVSKNNRECICFCGYRVFNFQQFGFDISKRKSRNEPKSCEQFKAFKTNRYCQLLQSSADLWAPLYFRIKPKWKCPIKKVSEIDN